MRWLAGVFLMGIVLSVEVAHAQFAAIVSDPQNLVVNTLTSIRSLLSNANEVTMINQQIQQLANDAKELASLPLSLVNEIDQAIKSYTDLLNVGQGISYQLKASIDQFESLYSQGFGGNGPFLQRAQRMLGQIREAGRLSTQITAVYTRLCDQQARVGQLMASSAAAIGQKSATQAGNQLLGVLTEQQVSIQGILATDQRLKISETMRQLVMEEKAYDDAQRFFGAMQPVTFRGPGEGKGFQLTD